MNPRGRMHTHMHTAQPTLGTHTLTRRAPSCACGSPAAGGRAMTASKVMTDATTSGCTSGLPAPRPFRASRRHARDPPGEVPEPRQGEHLGALSEQVLAPHIAKHSKAHTATLHSARMLAGGWRYLALSLRGLVVVRRLRIARTVDRTPPATPQTHRACATPGRVNGQHSRPLSARHTLHSSRTCAPTARSPAAPD